MCVYSMIMDWGVGKLYEWSPVTTQPIQPYIYPYPIPLPYVEQTLSIDNKLKEFIADLEDLLRRAKVYDEETNQRECEMESKKEKVRELARELGVEINLP